MDELKAVYDPISELQGKTFVITGAGWGIGFQTAILLSQLDCELFLIDKCYEKDWPHYENKLVKDPEKHHLIQCDVRYESDVNKAWREIGNKFPHGVVNSAGISLVDWAEKISLEKFQNVLEVNVHGSFLMARNYIRQLQTWEDGSVYGHVVNMGSLGSEQAFRGGAAYVASKGAIKAMTRQLARELRGKMCFICIQPETLSGESQISNYVVRRLQETRSDPVEADRHGCGTVPTRRIAQNYFLGSLDKNDWQSCKDIARLTLLALTSWARPLSGSSLQCLDGRS